MEQIAAIMLLVGCSADNSVCTEIPVPTPIYRSVAECEAQMPFEIRMSDTFDNRVLGACKAVDHTIFEQSASIDWAVSRSGQLQVEISAEPSMVASR